MQAHIDAADASSCLSLGHALLPTLQVAPGNWSYGEEVPEDFVNGYSYAIATGSAYIMSLFRQRCLAAAQQGQQLGQGQQHSLQGEEGDSDGLCSYHVDYPGSGTVAGSSEAEAGSAVGLGAYRQIAPGTADGGSDEVRLGRDVSSYRLGLQRPAGQSSSVVAGLQGKLGLGQRQQMRLGQSPHT